MSDNTNLNFKGQMKDEEVLCFTRKHWVLILPYFALLVGLIVGIGGFSFHYVAVMGEEV